MSFIKFKNVFIDSANNDSLQISGNLLPSDTNEYTLGSEAKKWNETHTVSSYIGDFKLTTATAGHVDTNFGNNGYIVTDFSGSNNFSVSSSSAIDKNNNIIVGGFVVNGFGGGGSYSNYALARYLPTGVLDTTFGTNGFVVTDFSGNDAYAMSISIDFSNNIIVYGSIINSVIAFARYLSTGQIDNTFGTNGVVITEINTNSFFNSFFNVLIDSQNNIIFFYNDDPNILISKFTYDGSLDTTFGDNGIVSTDFSGNDLSVGYSIILDNLQNIIIAGLDNSNDYGIARYSITGQLDTSFGTNGYVVADFSGNDYSVGYSLAVDQQNNIILAGAGGGTYSGDINYYALTKYLYSGVLDTTFGTNGLIITNHNVTIIPSFSFNNIYISVDEQNNLIIACNNGTTNYIIEKYSASGILDTNFGNEGYITDNFYNSNSSISQISSLKIDQQNNIIVSGFLFSFDTGFHYALARYLNLNNRENLIATDKNGTTYSLINNSGTAGPKGDTGDTGPAGPIGINTYFCQGQLNLDQDLNISSDTSLNFVADLDPNNWLNPYTFQPNVSGYYMITLQTIFDTSDNHDEVISKIIKNEDILVAIYKSEIPTRTRSISIGGSKLVYLNGTTDFIQFTSSIVTVAPTGDYHKILASSGTYFTAVLVSLASD
jgi:uncharacterized delta-60 repeat protein